MATDYDAPRKTDEDTESIQALQERVPDKLSGVVDVEDADNPGSFVKLASRGALPASIIASGFSSEEARGVLSGLAAHAIAPFSSPLTGGVALLFGVSAHAYGWPMAKGGSQRIAEALAKIIVGHGGTIETGRLVGSIDELPDAPTVILDVMPRAAVRIGGDRVTAARLYAAAARSAPSLPERDHLTRQAARLNAQLRG